MSVNLDGAIACVTGGARGIGKETVRQLANKGAIVWIGDIDIDLAEQTAREFGPRVFAHPLDVTEPASFAKFLDAAGPVTMLVNNAGVMHAGPFLDIDLDAHIREIAIDLTGVVIGMRLALPGMIERGEGHVVNIASMAGKFTVPGVANYNATKFGVVALSRVVRAEIADTPVTISTVLPSAVRTELISGISTKHVPTSDPSEIAAAIVGTAHNPRREVPVPRWASVLGTAEQLMPEALFEAAKRRAGGHRILNNVDAEQRSSYATRT